MKVTIRHEIRVSLPAGAGRVAMHLLLTPRSGPTQTVKDWRVEAPAEAQAVMFADAFDNKAHFVGQARPPEQVVVVASGIVETQDRNGVIGRVQGEPVPRLFLRGTAETQPDPELVEPLRNRENGRDRIGLLHTLMMNTPLALRSRAAAPTSQKQLQAAGRSQTQVQTLTARSTAARPGPPDAAHSFIGAARALGIPARYVSGYLAKESAAAPAMHAWAEAYDEALGWIGFDPLLQICPTDRHVRVAIGLDATSAAPLRIVPAPVSVGAPELSVEWAT